MTLRLAPIRLAPLFATALLATTAAAPLMADEFDLPPLVGGGPTAPAETEAGVAEAGVPDLGVPDVPGLAPGAPDVAEIGVPDVGAEGDAVLADDAPARASRNSTLELEFRALRSEDLAGGSTAAFRASAHWFGRARLGEDMGVLFNLRARGSKIEGVPLTFDDSLRIDVQELALTWQATPDLALEFGRVNIRNGVALGFNPTDWFKADSLVTTDSQDPGDRREERLGTLILGGSTTVGGTLLQFGYRPEISDGAGSVLTDMDVIGLGLDRTNPTEAVYLKLAPDLGGNIAFTGNLLLEDGHPGVGLEVSGALGQNLVVYGEVFAQDRRTLAAEALGSGLGSGGFRAAMGADSGYDWRTQAAVGATWSLPDALVGPRDVSLSLEYHYNGAGLSSGQTDALAAAAGADLGAAGAVRGFAAREQEPLADKQIFARFAWNDFWGDADFAALGFYAPHDESGLVQLSASIPLNDNAEISLRTFSTFGGSDTVYGANPTEMTTQIALTYTF